MVPREKKAVPRYPNGHVCVLLASRKLTQHRPIAGTELLVEERALLFHSSRNEGFRQPITPKVAEQLDRRRSISGVVVICKSENHDAALAHFLPQLDPFDQISLPIH